MNVHSNYIPEVGGLPLLHLKHIKIVCKVYKDKVNYKKAQGHLENVIHFLKIPSTRNFINWK
jgi:hypothetical protein